MKLKLMKLINEPANFPEKTCRTQRVEAHKPQRAADTMTIP